MGRYLLLITAFASMELTAFAATGEQMYAAQCAFCHGKAGEGSKKYSKALVGEKSIPQLADQIQRTMPQADPGSLSAADAKLIAAYVHDTFYSLAAREKKNPVRVELARLTVPQYRNAVADIIGHFRGNGTWLDKTRGLKGEYFKNRNHNQRLIERVDPEVAFDFGTNAPAEKDFDPKEYSARWSGSVYIPETGDYTFILQSNQSAKLFVNDNKTPIADGYVRSGNDNEYKGSIFLLGGRVYPIRLDFSKALQGVKDKNPKPQPAFVKLKWLPPQGTVETIPARNLSPQWSPEVYIVSTKFPPDDRSYGWERGTTVSKAWDAATTDAAFDAADFVSLRINDLAKTNEKDDKRLEKIKTFLKQFAKLAFRRPLTPDLEKMYVTKPLEALPDVQQAIKRSVLLVMKSPRFLYREPTPEPDQFDVASRLAFAMWDSIPNQELLDMAANGKLKTAEEVRKYVSEKMIWDTRAKARLLGFMHHWLKTDHGRDAVKDMKKFAGFDAALVADLRTSLDLFLEDVVWGSADFRTLLLGKEMFVNGRIGKYYGLNLPADAGFKKIPFEADKRTGVLTHPYMLSTLAYSSETSPIHRGVFIAKGILGTGLKPPQEAFTPLAPDLHPNLTTRQRVELQTKGANCQTCHDVINPLGFTLENFDAVGRFRAKENNQEINTVGTYIDRAGVKKSFNGPTEIAKFLAESPDVHTAFADQMFHHLVQQSIRAFGINRSEELRQTFAKSQFNIRELAIEVTVSSAMTGGRRTTAQK